MPIFFYFSRKRWPLLISQDCLCFSSFEWRGWFFSYVIRQSTGRRRRRRSSSSSSSLDFSRISIDIFSLGVCVCVCLSLSSAITRRLWLASSSSSFASWKMCGWNGESLGCCDGQVERIRDGIAVGRNRSIPKEFLSTTLARRNVVVIPTHTHTLTSTVCVCVLDRHRMGVGEKNGCGGWNIDPADRNNGAGLSISYWGSWNTSAIPEWK